MSNAQHVAENQRLANVNELIRVIGGCGRNFFQYRNERRYAYMEIDARGRVWFVDDYTQERIYTHYPHRWRNFSHGGTLRDLVCVFRDHIKKGAQINHRYFEPNSMWCSRHPWGYPAEDLEQVKSQALRLGILAVAPAGGDS